LATAQTCTTTDSLNVRSCAGTGCGIVTSLPYGTQVTLISADAPFANGHSWGRIDQGWVARTYLICNEGGSNPPPPPPPPPSPPSGGGSTDFSGFPTSYSTSGYTYTGRRAQVLNFLNSRFSSSATTYASHSDGPLASSDLWTPGAVSARDNSGVAGMNQLADYVAANLGPLGIRYVIWKQRINLGSGWSGMEDRGSITQNHFDHVHITFQGNFQALGATVSTFNQGSPADAIPGWAIGIIVLNVIVLVAVGAVVVVVIRMKTAGAGSGEHV